MPQLAWPMVWDDGDNDGGGGCHPHPHLKTAELKGTLWIIGSNSGQGGRQGWWEIMANTSKRATLGVVGVGELQ